MLESNLRKVKERMKLESEEVYMRVYGTNLTTFEYVLKVSLKKKKAGQ